MSDYDDLAARTVPLNVGGVIAVERNMDNMFPYGSYRPNQEDALAQSINAVNNPDVDVVLLEGPTGLGKSAINVALCRDSEDAFYTTPQKKLREQLANDTVLSNHFKTLKGRRDYICGETGDNCQECEIYQNPQYSCASTDNCTYWQNKLVAMNEQTAVITFAYLIVDTMMGEGDHAFDDRELLIVDEAQSLENQVANLFAGFPVGPHNLPEFLVKGETKDLDMDAYTHDDVVDIVDRVYAACETLVNMAEEKDTPFRFRGTAAKEKHVEEAQSFMDKVEWFRYETQEEGRDWVVETDRTYTTSGDEMKMFRLIPVKVDRFLDNFVWSRADTVVLSTATPPFRDRERQWLDRIGLGDANAVRVRADMPFPKENRPIHTDHMVCSMSGGGDKDNWDEIMATLDDIAGKHPSQNGLIHSASYSRAERIIESAEETQYQNLYRNCMMHEQGDDADETISEWLSSSKDILISPSMTEGVSLANDKCRWQVLLKVPYPSTGDNRVSYMLDETKGGWTWYNETAMNEVVQSAGRAVRHPDDHADYYVLDEAFNKLRKKVSIPHWFEEAIGVEPTSGQQSALEW